jgi:hypothetical protein
MVGGRIVYAQGLYAGLETAGAPATGP